MTYTNKKVKCLLKSEMVKRGVSTTDLMLLLNQQGLKETKSSIDSKISRGTFSATFFLQSLSVMGCKKIELEDYDVNLRIAAEPTVAYKTMEND